jgi:hypothetical protein
VQRKSDLDPTTTPSLLTPPAGITNRYSAPQSLVRSFAASSTNLPCVRALVQVVDCTLDPRLSSLLSSLLLFASKTHEYHRIQRYLSVNTIAHHGTERLLQTSTTSCITTTPSINPTIAATATALAALLRELQPTVSALDSTVLPHESSTTRRSSIAVRSPVRRPCVPDGQTWRTSI